MILTAAVAYPVMSSVLVPEAGRAAFRHWTRPEVAPFIPGDGVSLDSFAKVIVNDGRWIVICPACGSAQVAARNDPRFFCVECLNVDVGGQWIAVHWPDDADQIELVLLARPYANQRNWLPHESIDDLIAENMAHGFADHLAAVDEFDGEPATLNGNASTVTMPADFQYLDPRIGAVQMIDTKDADVLD